MTRKATGKGAGRKLEIGSPPRRFEQGGTERDTSLLKNAKNWKLSGVTNDSDLLKRL